MNAQPEIKGGGSPAQETAPNAKPDANQTVPRLSSKVALTMSVHVPLPLAMRVADEANRIDAEIRDRECRCPGRAYVAHAWDLASHRDGCRAAYAWLSVDEVRVVLQALPRRKLATLILATDGAA